MWFAEKREVCAAIADAARRHNQPPLQESGFKIIAPLVGHLLNGGYDLALIKRVAVAATLDYDEIRRYSKLFQLRMRVRAAQAQIDLDAHTKQKRIERDEAARSETLATIADAKRLDPRHRTQEMAITDDAEGVMSDFTPGPWLNVEPDATTPSRARVCTVAGSRGPTLIYDAPLTGETEANARLIAAAPEMHEALEEAALAMSAVAYESSAINDAARNYLIDRIAAIRAALAKADGLTNPA